MRCWPSRREGYRKTDIDLADLFDALTYAGLWRFLKKYPRMCWEKLRRSFSKELFCDRSRSLVPEIRAEDLTTGGAGVRAQALAPAGELVQDFHFVTGRTLACAECPQSRGDGSTGDRRGKSSSGSRSDAPSSGAAP